jgi:hypothetical protein
MRRLVVTLALACLAGCASTASEIRQSGRTVEWQSKAPPASATSCVSRRSEEVDPNLIGGVVREGNAPGSFEATIRVSHVAVAVVEARPSATGSIVKMWNRSDQSDAFVEKLRSAMKGC